MMYDAIVLGKGPAGISASIYLARAGLSVLVIGKDSGALERAEYIENYYGFPEPVSGAELAARGVAQAERLGALFEPDEAINLGMEDVFVVRTTEAEYRARAILVATGKQRAGLKVPGFEEFRGKGISFCATCDGFFFRGKTIAVIGAGDYAASELGELLHVTKNITLFTDGSTSLTCSLPAGIPVVTEKISAFEGSVPLSPSMSSRLERIVTINAAGQFVSYPVDGAFVAIGTAGAADFAAKLGVEIRGTDVVVDGDFRTNVPGVFAAGDCIGGFYQVAKAVSDGAQAAKAMISFLKNQTPVRE